MEGHEVARLTRLYTALSQISQAVVRARGRDELLARICEVLVAHAGFQMAWIGWDDPEHKCLRTGARSGDDRGYFERATSPTREGPSESAFRDGRANICNDVSEDPATVPWRSDVMSRGWRACAALPIRAQNAVTGVLTVFSDQRNAFQDKEIELLAEVAADISFTLQAIERDGERQLAGEAVRRLAAIVESSNDAIIGKTLEGKITSWNAAAERMFGYTASEANGRNIDFLIPAERAAEEPMILASIRRGERITSLETVRLRKDGTPIPVSVTVSPIWAPGDGNSILGISKTVRDMTQRNQSEDIAEKEHRFASALIEAMPGIFYLQDESGRFLRWNRNLERVSGYSAIEISAMHARDLTAVEDQSVLEKHLSAAFTDGEASFEGTLHAKDGIATPYFFTGKRHVLDGAQRLIGVGVDISNRKRAEDALRQSEARYRSTLDTMLEGCQLIGGDWRYLYLNAAAAIQNRRPNAELIGQAISEVWPDIQSTHFFDLLRRCMEDRVSVHDQAELAFSDGSKARFDVRAQPVPEGIFVLSIDITKRWTAETALRELNGSLERKVAERTADLEAACERAEAADKIKSTFLAAMSHELRTPLNSILGFTGIVLKGMAGPLNDEQSKQLEMVQGSARHLLDLINDVLDISKIEAGQLDVRCTAFDLRESVERVTASIMGLAKSKKLTVEVSVPDHFEPVESDQRRVEQILLNLVNNALKFTDHGGVIVTVDGLGSPSRAIRVRVSDTGIGIKPDDMSKLFKPFRQLDTGLQRQHEGTGLGLAICQKLAELLGGMLDVESDYGRGSVFTLLLPSTRQEPS